MRCLIKKDIDKLICEHGKERLALNRLRNSPMTSGRYFITIKYSTPLCTFAVNQRAVPYAIEMLSEKPVMATFSRRK